MKIMNSDNESTTLDLHICLPVKNRNYCGKSDLLNTLSNEVEWLNRVSLLRRRDLFENQSN